MRCTACRQNIDNTGAVVGELLTLLAAEVGRCLEPFSAWHIGTASTGCRL
jgi:hypothetical protein